MNQNLEIQLIPFSIAIQVVKLERIFVFEHMSGNPDRGDGLALGWLDRLTMENDFRSRARPIERIPEFEHLIRPSIRRQECGGCEADWNRMMCCM